MKKNMRKIVWIAAMALTLASLAGPSYAQQAPDAGGRTALENARGGQVRARSPGNLVQAGVAQARMFGRGADIGVDVTETEHPPSIFSQVLAESIDFLFEQINEAIELIGNLLLLRAGETPRSAGNLSFLLPQETGSVSE
jgi:hypothetical protein